MMRVFIETEIEVLDTSMDYEALGMDGKSDWVPCWFDLDTRCGFFGSVEDTNVTHFVTPGGNYVLHVNVDMYRKIYFDHLRQNEGIQIIPTKTDD